MLLFWSVATLLVAFTLGVLLWPLLRARHGAIAPDDDSAAIAVYRDQKRALDAECAAGAITPSERDATLAELARRVSEDVTVGAPAPSPAPPEGTAAPAPKRAWALALALILLVPAAAFTLYQRLGTPVAAVAATDGGTGHEMSERQIAAMVDSLAQRLKQHPDDANGWVLLAHSYQALERFPEAANAYARADALIPNNADLLADYADTLAMAQGRKLEGAPAALIQRALAIDPKHKKALALAGTVTLETHDLDASIAYWRRLAAELPAGSDEARQVADVIAEVDAAKREGKGGSVAPSKRAGATAPAPPAPQGDKVAAGLAITGRVDLNGALASKVALNDTVFIFARATEGPRMPLAVLRIPAKELPRDFSLDDSMSMAPGVKLSAVPSVIVEARISKSGNALPQPGDLFGRSAPLKPGVTGVRITIDQVVP
jgi:cytochrome c-type biogenesis protein CcmH